ncbi:hypothetical protein, partial [Escherichia coli]|uniref:hypothetical protein n=1 Tax=Escherichia coli TaxID=562 RepID=UPI003F66270E
TGPQSIHILRGVRQQQDEPGRFSICSRQAAVVLSGPDGPLTRRYAPTAGKPLSGPLRPRTKAISWLKAGMA